MAGHGHQLRAPGGRVHHPPRIGDGERDRLFDQHVLAGLERRDGHVGVILRRQGQHQAVDFSARTSSMVMALTEWTPASWPARSAWRSQTA
jgi:hypothetical protein